MLPVPNLDDRSFEQIMREAKELIPRLAPDWTDENAHDPGITLLELLAWHIEMQQYRINRMSVEYDRKFLALLGGWPMDRQPATTSVSFTQVHDVTYIPFGTAIKVGQLQFETVRSITIIPERATSITLKHEGTSKELTQNIRSGRVVFYPFGDKGEVGSQMIITLEKPLPQVMPLSLFIELDGQPAAHRIPARYKQFYPSATVEWSYYAEDEQGGSWQPLRMERDESYSFHQSGPILFELPFSSQKIATIKAEVVAGRFDDIPRVRRMMWNEVFTSQGKTWCIEQRFDGWGEETRKLGQSEPVHLYLYHALFLSGHVQVQYKLEDGWIDVSPQYFHFEYGDTYVMLIIEPFEMIPIGNESIRVVGIDPEFVDKQYIGSGTGISHQVYPLPISSIYSDQLLVQVGEWNPELNQMLWRDWDRVLDFDHSTMSSPHYVISEDEQIFFSDGIYGMSPSPSPAPNIRFISYRTGEGRKGNVKEDTLKSMIVHNQQLQVSNLFPAYGGRDPETIAEALARTKLEVLDPKCAITEKDIEARVLEIPGVNIARVKAISGYHRALTNYPQERAMGHISIVVVPRSSHYFANPSEGLKQTIAVHMEPYRLLTNNYHIIGPEYIKVTIRAVIVVEAQYEGKEHEVVTALNQWLIPEKTSQSDGWEFGKSINKSDVYDYIHSVAGIVYIQDLWIMAEGHQVTQEEGGDIRIPPNGLAYSGEHEIEFIIQH